LQEKEVSPRQVKVKRGIMSGSLRQGQLKPGVKIRPLLIHRFLRFNVIKRKEEASIWYQAKLQSIFFFSLFFFLLLSGKAFHLLFFCDFQLFFQMQSVLFAYC
jgi:hypothetical protein